MFKKSLSLLLAIAMVLTALPSTSYAAEESQEVIESVEAQEVADPVSELSETDVITEEPAKEEPAAAPAAAEPAASDPAAEEPAAETPAEEPAQPAGDDAVIPAGEAAEPAAGAQEETADAGYPAQTFRGDSVNGVHVNVSADKGVFPEGTTMKVRAVGDRKAQTIAEQTVSENEVVTDAIAVDITFYKDGKEIEPAAGKQVRVSITLDDALEGDSYLVIHQDDTGDASVIAQASEDRASFKSGSFSIYVVAAVEETDPRLEVRFFMPGDDEPYSTQFITQGSDLHDPGVVNEEMTSDEVFVGWNVGGTEVSSLEELQALVPSSIQSGDTMDVTAVIHVERRLVYERLDGIIKNSEDYIVPEDPGTKTVTVNQSYTVASATLGFIGWAEYVNGEIDESVIYKNGDTITLTKPETILRPVVREGHWMIFNENDDTYDTEGHLIESGGASYTEPAFYLPTDITEAPANPNRPGYDFAYWSTDEAGNNEYHFGSAMGNAEVELYAQWTPKSDAHYTVIVWQQKVTDDKDAADADKTYDYYTSSQVPATTGATISASDLSGYTSLTFEGFEYSRYEIKNGSGNDTTTVGARNDTVVNVYYDRQIYTIRFFGTTTDSYSTTPEQYRNISNNTFRALGYSGSYWTYNGSRYNGTRYKVTDEMTGLYGSSLADNGYTWPSGNWVNVSFVSAFEGNLFGNSLTGGVPGALYTKPSTSTPNVTIVNYLQSPDDAGSYPDTYESEYYFANASSQYRITERFSGYEPAGYKWSTSADMPTSWDTALTNTGFTQETRGDNTYLHIKYDRVKSSIVFSNGADTVKQINQVPYGKSIAGYESQAPTISPEEGYFFAGWYTDPELVNEVDWSSETMPSANLLLYAKTVPERFHLVFDPDGGTVPNGQNLSFRVDYGDTVSGENFNNATKDDHSLLGWFLEDGTQLVFDATHIIPDIADMTYQYDTARRAQYGDNTPSRADVVGLVLVHAEWRDDTVASRGGIGLRYVAEDGTEIYHEREDHRYLDRVTAVARNIPDDLAELQDPDRYFVGWKVAGHDDLIIPAGDLIPVSIDDAVDLDSNPDDDEYNYVVTLTAVYMEETDQQLKHTKLVYKANGGTGDDVTVEPLAINGKVAVKTKAEGELAFSRDQYVLVGWSTSADTDPDSADVIAFGQEIYIDNKQEDTENILYAVWRQNTFTVTWVNDSGALLETDLNVPAGSTPSYDGETPTKEATAEYTYSFSGWTPAISPVEGDVTYTATYTATKNQYTVTYNLNGGSVDDGVATSYTVDYGDPTPRITPTRLGYTLTGWSPSIANTVTGNVTYIAQWTAADVTYTVKHYGADLTGGTYTVLDSYTVTGKTDETRYAEPHSFPGYEIDWEATAAHADNASNTVEVGEERVGGTVAGDGSLVLALVYKRSTYKVTYRYIGSFPDGMIPAADANGNITDTNYTRDYTFGETVTIKPTATAPAGYTAEDWHTVSGSSLDISDGSFDMPARDVIIVASVTPDTDTVYTINHYVLGLNADGTLSDEYVALESYTRTGTTDTQATATSKTYEGVTFDKTTTQNNLPDGISAAETGSGMTLTGTIAGDGSLTFNFYYTRNQYTVSYECEGRRPTDVVGWPDPDEETYYYGATVTVADDPTAQGYTFDGWTSLTTGVSTGSFTMPAEHVTIVGHFTPVTDGSEYTVEYYLQNLDGTYTVQTASRHGTASTTATVNAPDFTGYTPNWTKTTDENTGNTVDATAKTVSGTILGDGSLVLKFYYDRNTYTVTYEYEGTVPAGAKDIADFNTPVVTAVYGAEVTIAEMPEGGVPAGYTFSGFDVVSGSTITVEGGKFSMPARNVELIGHFTANSNTKYTVKHYLKDLTGDGYTLIDSYEKTGTTDTNGSANERASEYDGAIYDDAAKTKTRTEAEAAGQTVSADGETITATIAGDGSLVLAFYYSRDSFTVSYVYDGYEPTDAVPTSANLPAPRSYKFGETVTLTDDATADGYTFSGWDVLTHDFDIEPDGTFAMPARDVQFHGHFTPEAGGSEFTVEHYLQNLDGTYPDEANYWTTYTGTALQTGTGNARDYEGFSPNWTKTMDENEGNTVNATAKTISGTILGDNSLVLKFYYDRNTYTVTYEYEGTAPAGAKDIADFNTPVVTAVYGEEVTIAEMPEDGVPAGYTFSGFDVVTGSTITVEGGKFSMPARNVELIGHFTANSNTKYTITHYVEKINADGTVVDGEYDVLSSYERTGTTDTSVSASAREFPGVVYDADTTDSNKGSAQISADRKTLTANVAGDGSLHLDFYYTRQTYSVSYVYDGYTPTTASDLPATQTDVKYGQTVTIAGNASAEGYSFGGWKIVDTSDVTVVGSQFAMPARDVVLHGTFTPIPNGATYTIRHYVQKTDLSGYDLPTDHDHQHEYTRTGTALDTVTAVAQSYTGFAVNLEKTREAAAALDDRYNCTVADNGSVSGTVYGDGTLVLSIYYDRVSYEVEYEYEGTVPAGAKPVADFNTPAVTAPFGTEVTIAAMPDSGVPAGYTFSGFAPLPGSTITVDGNTFTMPARKVELVGRFTANTDTEYTVEHYQQNVSGEGYTKVEADTEELTGTTGTTARANSKSYTGFTVNTQLSTTTGTIAGDGSLVLKIYYDRNSHNVTYYFSGNVPDGAGALPTSQPYLFGQEVTVEDRPSAPAGYTFDGWEKRPGSDLDVEMDGAYIAENATFDMPDRDVTFYGHFAANTDTPYTVEYYWNNVAGDAYELHEAFTGKEAADFPGGEYPENYSYDSALVGTTDSTVTAEEKEYAGLTLTDTADTVASDTLAGDGSTVLKLYYDRNSYTVTYRYTNTVDGASALPEQGGGVFGELVTVADKASAPGYTFHGWSMIDQSEELTTLTMPARNVILEGYFEAIASEYDVEFYYEENGTYEGVDPEIDTRSATTGASVQVTTEDRTPRTGYILDTTAGNVTSGTVSGYNSTTGEGTKLVLKLYFKQQFSVTYLPGEHGTFQRQITNGLSYGADTPAAPDTTQAEEGYVFTGWNTKGGTTDATVTETKTYTAQWSEDKNGNDIPDEDDRFTVVYTDGVDDEVVFADEITGNLSVGDDTPIFHGDTTRYGLCLYRMGPRGG